MAGSVGVALAVVLTASSTLATTEGVKTVRPLHTLDRATMPHVEAVEFRLKDTPLDDIFAVPERGAIGTSSLNNAITLIDLSGGKPRFREVRRNFIKSVSVGKKVFLPEFSKDTIGYTQTRGFLLFNVKTGEFRDHLPVRLIQETLEDVAVLDWEKRLFLFNVQFLPGFNDPVTELHVVDLSGDRPKSVAKFEIEKKPQWALLGKTTFFFTVEGERQRLNALDASLKPVAHPILPVYNGSGGVRDADLPRAHPTLPVAIFASEDGAPAGKLVVWAASWGTKDGSLVIHKLLESVSGGFQFSPDGKWVVFRDRTEKPMTLMAMPVDPSLPHLFGAPVRLRATEQVPDEWNGNCAWISDPLAVVCNVQQTVTNERTGDERRESKLLKWELSPANVRR